MSYSCADRGFDIGRHDHLDWSLPDPQRVVSGKHCEVRFEDGQFILFDISTNGTFLNGSPNRMDKAHVLRSGDRLMIGDYIIVVSLEADDVAGLGFANAPAPAVQSHSQPWEAPQASVPAAQESSWPSAPSPGQTPLYPQTENAGGPWTSPAVGMEGRHAPPSSAPGIGTPVDDVWSRDGHGSGNADPALYDPQTGAIEREPVRPAQADPLDHLAQQPHLQPAQDTPAFSGTTQDQGSQSPFARESSTGAATQEEEPLFKMPELGAKEDHSQGAATPQAMVAEPVQNDPSPFPETSGQRLAEPLVGSEDENGFSDVKETASARSVESEPSDRSDPPVHEQAVAPVSGETASSDILKAFAEGAGIPVSVLEGRDPEDFAREIGNVLQGMTEDMMGLLQARSQVKAMTRNANRTLIGRSGNNALKFSPTPQMALQTMLSENAEENGYLPMAKAMTAAFKDIQKHHVWTYAAMQKAAARFDDTLSPKALEDDGQVAKSAFGNQKAKLWDRLQERWTSLSGAYDDGVVGVFTQYFTESYEELSSDDPDQSSG
ncbi:MAG: type VI secretion system-associated FHA domain protein TagH [Roseibium sp.]|nr:type VI secretion system-associated FHA domain protein TagH [Roseibium sp.]